jgi:hypothetical protein
MLQAFKAAFSLNMLLHAPPTKWGKLVLNLFVCSLFNDTVSSSDYISLNDGMITEKWHGKDMEGNNCGLI